MRPAQNPISRSRATGNVNLVRAPTRPAVATSYTNSTFSPGLIESRGISSRSRKCVPRNTSVIFSAEESRQSENKLARTRHSYVPTAHKERCQRKNGGAHPSAVTPFTEDSFVAPASAATSTEPDDESTWCTVKLAFWFGSFSDIAPSWKAGKSNPDEPR